MITPKTKNLFKSRIPFWSVLLIIFILTAGFIVWAIYSRVVVLKYDFSLPNNQGSVVSLKYGSQPMLSNTDYFQQIVAKLIQEKGSFIEADLSTMQLKIYIGGLLAKTVPILAKGLPGSWWETPAGIYKIETKETKHFSSIGKVYMPWSMAFQGNFFIHGIPYYPNGTKVSSAYSGGCIRLADSDAKDVYEIIQIGEPILVFEKNLVVDDFQYQNKIPGITAKDYLVADLENNFVFFEKFSKNAVIAPSAAKLITSLVAMEYINFDKKITIKEEMLVPTSIPRLKLGQKISLYDLLHLLLLESSSEAAEAISLQSGQENFIELMNQKTKAIGMVNSNFQNASGVGVGNISTAEDLFILAKYIYGNRSFIFKLTAGSVDYSFYGKPEISDLKNLNAIDRSEFFGGEMGKSELAGESMVSVFEIEKDGKKRPVSVIVLESEDAVGDTKTIFDYVKNSFF